MTNFNSPFQKQNRINTFQIHWLYACQKQLRLKKKRKLSPCLNNEYSQQGNIELLQFEQLIVLPAES